MFGWILHRVTYTRCVPSLALLYSCTPHIIDDLLLVHVELSIFSVNLKSENIMDKWSSCICRVGGWELTPLSMKPSKKLVASLFLYELFYSFFVADKNRDSPDCLCVLQLEPLVNFLSFYWCCLFVNILNKTLFAAECAVHHFVFAISCFHD